MKNISNALIWGISLVIAVVLFIGVYFLYTSLKKEHESENFKDNLVTVGESTKDTEKSNESEESVPEEGSNEPALPNFTVTDMNGNTAELYDFLDKPVVLNFWASWCPPCKSEMPHFEAAYKKYPDVNFLMVNVTMSQGESIEAAKGHISSQGYTFPVYFDTTGMAASLYQAYSLPTTYFIYKGGDNAVYAVGAISMENLEEGIGMIK